MPVASPRVVRAGLIALCALALGLAGPAAAGAAGPGVLTAVGCIDDNDAPDGPDACAQSIDGMATSRDVAVSPDGRSVYVVSTTDDAIVRFDRDPATGAITPRGCIDDNDAPEGPDACAQSADALNGAENLAVSPDGESVYVASDNEDAIAVFDRDASGALTPAGCVDDNDTGPETCALSVDGLDLVNGIAVSADGLNVYAAAGGDDAIVRLNRNPSTGALSDGDCVEDNDGPDGPDVCGQFVGGLNGVEEVTVSPDGRSVYATSDNEDALVRLDRNTSNGALTPQGCIESNDAGRGPDACATSTDGLKEPKAVIVSPDSASVFVAGFQPAIVRFSRDLTTGALTSTGCVTQSVTTGPPFETCAQSTPALTGAQSLAVTEDALHTAAAGTSAVTSFRRGPYSGLTPTGCVGDTGSTTCPATTGGLATVREVAVSLDGRDVYAVGDEDAVVHFAGERPPECTGRATAGTPGAAQVVPLDCSDLNNDPVTIEIVRGPSSGSLGAVDQNARTVSYTPNDGFSGLDSFTYRAVADGARSQVATASVLVQAAAGPAGPAGPPGAPGATGPAGPPGATGPAGQPAIRLLALLGQDTVSARSGQKVSFRMAATAPGTATLEILRGRTVLATLRKTVTKAGRTSIAWDGRTTPARGRRAAPLPAGRYTLRLTVAGRDRQRATDAARLTITRPPRKR